MNNLDYIIDPETNKRISVYTNEGRDIIIKYKNSIHEHVGGARKEAVAMAKLPTTKTGLVVPSIQPTVLFKTISNSHQRKGDKSWIYDLHKMISEGILNKELLEKEKIRMTEMIRKNYPAVLTDLDKKNISTIERKKAEEEGRTPKNWKILESRYFEVRQLRISYLNSVGIIINLLDNSTKNFDELEPKERIEVRIMKIITILGEQVTDEFLEQLSKNPGAIPKVITEDYTNSNILQLKQYYHDNSIDDLIERQDLQVNKNNKKTYQKMKDLLESPLKKNTKKDIDKKYFYPEKIGDDQEWKYSFRRDYGRSGAYSDAIQDADGASPFISVEQVEATTKTAAKIISQDQGSVKIYELYNENDIDGHREVDNTHKPNLGYTLRNIKLRLTGSEQHTCNTRDCFSLSELLGKRLEKLIWTFIYDWNKATLTDDNKLLAILDDIPGVIELMIQTGIEDLSKTTDYENLKIFLLNIGKYYPSNYTDFELEGVASTQEVLYAYSKVSIELFEIHLEKYRIKKTAGKTLQRVFRGTKVRQELKHKKFTKSAEILQRAVRVKNAQRELQKKQSHMDYPQKEGLILHGDHTVDVLEFFKEVAEDGVTLEVTKDLNLDEKQISEMLQFCYNYDPNCENEGLFHTVAGDESKLSDVEQSTRRNEMILLAADYLDRNVEEKRCIISLGQTSEEYEIKNWLEKTNLISVIYRVGSNTSGHWYVVRKIDGAFYTSDSLKVGPGHYKKYDAATAFFTSPEYENIKKSKVKYFLTNPHPDSFPKTLFWEGQQKTDYCGIAAVNMAIGDKFWKVTDELGGMKYLDTELGELPDSDYNPEITRLQNLCVPHHFKFWLEQLEVPNEFKGQLEDIKQKVFQDPRILDKPSLNYFLPVDINNTLLRGSATKTG